MKMIRKQYMAPFVAGLILMLIQLPVAGATAPVGKVASAAGVSKLNGIDLTLESTLFAGDLVSTGAESTAVVYLPGGGKIHLGAETEANFSDDNGTLVIDLREGGLAALKTVKQSVVVHVRGLTVSPSSSSGFEVATVDNIVYVAAKEKDVNLLARNQNLVVPAGKVLKVEMAVADVTDGAAIGANGFQGGEVISNVLLGALIGGVAIPVLAFVFKELNDCDPTVSPRDPDCGSGFAGN